MSDRTYRFYPSGRPNRLTLVAGQGDIGGGEYMLLRIGEAARDTGWSVAVLGPDWGSLRDACLERNLPYLSCTGRDRRSYAIHAAAWLARPGRGTIWANGALPTVTAATTPNPLVVHLHQLPGRATALAVRLAARRARVALTPSTWLSSQVAGTQAMVNWTDDLSLLDRTPDPNSFTVAFVGRISIEKGVDTLAHAVDILGGRSRNRMRLVIAGDSRFVSTESAQRAEFSLRDCRAEVVREGWAEPQRVLRQADVVVVPSRTSESFGLVAAEAMALGCPLVVSDAGALPELVGSGYPWIFGAGDARGLAEHLGRIREQGSMVEVTSLRLRWEKLFSPRAGKLRLGRILAALSGSK